VKVVADAVRGNTHLQTVVLERNDDVTDASMGGERGGECGLGGHRGEQGGEEGGVQLCSKFIVLVRRTSRAPRCCVLNT
jgi:hypothetical protein